MRNLQILATIFSSIPLLLFAASLAGCEGNKPNAATGCYSSPVAVFNAFREANSKRDWAKCLACLSPTTQEEAIYEAFFACAEIDSDQSRDLLKKHHLDELSLSRSYGESTGAHTEDDGMRRDDANKGAAPLTAGRDVMREIVCKQVPDKENFFVDARNLLEGNAASAPLGELQELTVDGSIAKGISKISISYKGSTGNGVSQSFTKETYKTFIFKSLNGSWLIDSL